MTISGSEANMFLVTLYFLSEMLVHRYKRRADHVVSRDQGSLHLLIMISAACLLFAKLGAIFAPQARIDILRQLPSLGVAVFAAGLTLRWYAIILLGRYFTTEVSIAADHKLIETGPYRLLRHPSYTGILLQFIAFGICSANGLALAILVLPTTMALLHRIRIEEAVLTEAFGNRYTDYTRRTKRLIPFVY
jgi:protein-S-isoprenylcysteine O-methyltransferase